MTTTTPTTNQSISSSEKRDWAALERKYYQHTFNRSLVMERGEGVRVWDAHGTVYLDLVEDIGGDARDQIEVDRAVGVPDAHTLAALHYKAAVEGMLVIFPLQCGPVAFFGR